MAKKRPEIINIQQFVDHRGRLSVLESGKSLPFQLRRIYFIDGLQPGILRAGHAHRTTEEVIVAIEGRIQVSVDSSSGPESFTLEKGGPALYIPALNWLTLNPLTVGGICLVLASTLYDERDYIRDYDVFMEMTAR